MEKIIVGKIINSHGIKGEIKIKRTGNESFSKDVDYYIGESLLPVRIISARISKELAYVKLSGYDNINEILKFKGQLIYIDKSMLEELEENAYYIHDLLGLKVYDQERIFLGDLVEVLTYSANDVYIVKGENKEYKIPAVKEFILNINLKENEMTVKLIEGM